MAQVGQTTPSGGREWTLSANLSACRQVTIPDNCTLNHIGCWLRESTVANTRDVRAAIYSTAGILQFQTALLSAGVNSTSFELYQLAFSGQSLSAGNYILSVAASGDGSDSKIIMQGQNDSTGLPTYQNPEDPIFVHPNFPADASAFTRTDAARQWDIYLDYTPVTTATLSSPTPSGTIGTTTTATIGATTDQTTGTFYVVVDTPANLAGVTAEQIKAGQRADSNAAVASNDAAVSTTSPSAGVTGLVAGTSYAYAAVQNNANGDSNVVTGTFTTASGAVTSRPGSGGARSKVATLLLS